MSSHPSKAHKKAQRDKFEKIKGVKEEENEGWFLTVGFDFAT